jgi:hypothetical protein
MADDFNRVVARLHMGCAPPPGDWWRDTFGVIAFCAQEYQPGPEGFPRIIKCPINDAVLNGKEAQLATLAARQVVRSLQQGERVLVTCMQGRNRSGLVTALALLMLGASPNNAIKLVRAARGSTALSNQSFVQWLKTLQPAPGYHVARKANRSPISEST